MNKPYFAKYLPVEGEIKKGYMLDTHKNEVIYYNGDYGEKRPDYLKPVKLFLCSRDIIEGDEVQDSSGFKYNVDDKRFKLLSAENEYLKTKVFKVIGEISPDATWVKEGDEFDESDIDHGGWVDEDLKTILIKIKGPCGHFH